MHQAHHVGRGQDLVHAPPVGGPDIHVFDKPEHDAGAAEMPRHGQDFMVVGAAFDDHVDLQATAGFSRHMAQARGNRGLYALEHVIDREINVVHAAKHGVVQAVQADRHPLQAGVLEGLCLACQQGAVGGECDVQRRAIGRSQSRQLRDQHFNVLAQQRLAAGQPYLAYAMGHTQPGQARNLLETQQRRVRQIDVVLVKNLLGHAIAAAEVAAVGNTDAQVAQRAVQAVVQHAVGHHGLPARTGPCAGVAQVQQGDDAFRHRSILP